MRTFDITSKGHKFEFTEYDGVTEMVEQCRASEYAHKQMSIGSNKGCKGGSWHGRSWKDMKDLFDLTLAEWDHGLAVIDRMERELDAATLPQPKDRRRKLKFRDDDGDEIDLDRLRDGRDYWRLSTRQFTQGPTSICLAVDITTSCGVNSDDALWRGAACVTLAGLLERAGYRVEMWVVQGSRINYESQGSKGPRHQMSATCVKRTSDPMDKATLINAVSVWFYRSITFGTIGANSEGRKYRDTLGSCHTPSPSDLRHVVPSGPVVYVNGVFNFRDASDLVKRTLEQLNAGELSRA